MFLTLQIWPVEIQISRTCSNTVQKERLVQGSAGPLELHYSKSWLNRKQKCKHTMHNPQVASASPCAGQNVYFPTGM